MRLFVALDLPQSARPDAAFAQGTTWSSWAWGGRRVRARKPAPEPPLFGRCGRARGCRRSTSGYSGPWKNRWGPWCISMGWVRFCEAPRAIRCSPSWAAPERRAPPGRRGEHKARCSRWACAPRDETFRPHITLLRNARFKRSGHPHPRASRFSEPGERVRASPLGARGKRHAAVPCAVRSGCCHAGEKGVECMTISDHHAALVHRAAGPAGQGWPSFISKVFGVRTDTLTSISTRSSLRFFHLARA